MMLTIMPDALFNERTGLVITDEINAEQVSIKSFPVANYKTSQSDHYVPLVATELFTHLDDDYTTLWICRNEKSDTVSGVFQMQNLNGGNKYVTLQAKSGDLYAPTGITVAPDTGWNNTGKIVTPSEPWVLAVTFEKATNTIRQYLNGSQIDSSVFATWALVTDNALQWRTLNYSTDIRFFGVWHFSGILTTQEMIDIASGIYPQRVPLKQYVHMNYGDVLSHRIYSSHSRDVAAYAWASNYATADEATMWTSRYDNPAFAFPLFYGYTKFGVYVTPYSALSAKMMSFFNGDIEYPASHCIHNMYESRLYFDAITDATIKAIFDKSNRTYWKDTIESEDHYIDAGAGYYGVWHPSQLQRDFILLHAETGHENHIFASVRTSGTVVTGITALRVYKTNLT